MIKYERNKLQKSERTNKTVQKKTHLERKAQVKNSSFHVDLSSKPIDYEQNRGQRFNDLSEVTQLINKIEVSQIEDDSLLRSPLNPSREFDDSSAQTRTIKKEMSPAILGGRLTIKSINNIENPPGSYTTIDDKRSEFKAKLIQSAMPISSNQILSNFAQTPFDSSPVKAYNNELLMEVSNEKLRAPNIRQQQQQKYKSYNLVQFEQEANLSPHQRYKDLVSKGQIINKERDSTILKQKKEIDSNEGLSLFLMSNSQIDDQYQQQQHQLLFQTPLVQRSSQNSESNIDDLEECPPLSPNNQGNPSISSSNISFSDHRFSVRQIQFNLISSLVGTNNRTSFVSRASNKLSKNHNTSNSSSTFTNQQKRQPFCNQGNAQCSQRCSRGFKSLFNCCNNQYNGSARNKNDSIYSNGSAFNKVLLNNAGSSFLIKDLQRNSNSLYQRTEDFSDEVDEYDNDSANHRLSIVKRKNINISTIFQPGKRIREQSNQIITIVHQTPEVQQSQQNKLNQFVTKVPMPNIQNQQYQQIDIQNISVNLNSTGSMQQYNTITNQKNSNGSEDSQTNSSGVLPQDIHRLHFLQTIQALHTIRNVITMPNESEIEHMKIDLPPPRHPNQKKVLIFDMDETLIHCVDDIEQEEPDVIIPIDFPDEEDLVNAGVNVRPYIYDCLEEASKYFQVIVFTASHKAYADAILDFLDPENKYFQYRLYRDNCVQTREGYYVKDLRIIRNRDLKDVVIIDNSVFSFSFHINNGIPIIPFYADKEDEEMLHLIYYLNCLVNVDDVREQNKEAFELVQLQNQSPLEIINNYYSTNNQQQLLLQNSEVDYQNERGIIIEENEETQEIQSERSNQENEQENDDQYQVQHNLQLSANQDFYKDKNTKAAPKRLLMLQGQSQSQFHT